MCDMDINVAVREYQDLIHSTVNKFYPKLKKRYTKEDLESDCYLKLWQSTERWQNRVGGVSFGLYAKIAMENAMFERLKRKKIDIQSLSLTVLDDDGGYETLDIEDKSANQYQRLLASDIVDKIDNLPTNEKITLTEVLINGNSQAEVAYDREVSREMVRTYYNSGIKKIRKAFVR